MTRISLSPPESHLRNEPHQLAPSMSDASPRSGSPPLRASGDGQPTGRTQLPRDEVLTRLEESFGAARHWRFIAIPEGGIRVAV